MRSVPSVLAFAMLLTSTACKEQPAASPTTPTAAAVAPAARPAAPPASPATPPTTPPAAPPTVGSGAEGPLMVAHGKALEVAADHIVVESKDEPVVRVSIASDTNVQVDGKKGAATQIIQGSQVHVAYRTVGNVPTAVTVEGTAKASPTPK
jgi:hypothetical protein